jgi:hypothetical protein
MSQASIRTNENAQLTRACMCCSKVRLAGLWFARHAKLGQDTQDTSALLEQYAENTNHKAIVRTQQRVRKASFALC